MVTGDSYFSEAPVYVDEDDNRYTDFMVANFNSNVLQVSAGVEYPEITDFENDDVQRFFEALVDKYGDFTIRKTYPDKDWGDTTGYHYCTGAAYTFEELSQYITIDFETIIRIDSITIAFEELEVVSLARPPIQGGVLGIPNDPQYDSYSFNGFNWTSNWGFLHSNLYEGFDLTTGDNSIVIGVPDDFSGSSTFPTDLTGKVHYSNVTRYGNHGLMVAGLIGAKTNNNWGISSTGYDCEVALSYHTYGGTIPSAIQNLVDNGASVINCSWVSYSSDLKSKIESLIGAGVIFVAGSGRDRSYLSWYPNHLPQVHYPAAYEFGSKGEVFAVTSSFIDRYTDDPGYGPWGTEKWIRSLNYGPDDNYFIDFTAPGYDLKSLGPSNSFVIGTGTSAASAFVSGVCGLIKSLDSELLPTEVYDILKNTADKVPVYDIWMNNGNDDGSYDSLGYSRCAGWGRVNVYQALLYTLAYISAYNDLGAFADGNARNIEKGSDSDDLHLVFGMGGEIFYKRSTDAGSTWDTTYRLSKGNGLTNPAPGSIDSAYQSSPEAPNQYPSICVTNISGTDDDNLMVVWQRKLSNTNYEIWFSESTDNGDTWSDAEIINGCSSVTVSAWQSPTSWASGPTPVIASLKMASGSYSHKFVTVFASNGGLKYRTKYIGQSWTVPGTDRVPGSYTDTQVWGPCLANHDEDSDEISLIFDIKGQDSVLSAEYDGTNDSWSSLGTVNWSGNGYQRYSNIAVDNNGYKLAVWSSYNGSDYAIRFRRGNTNNTWSGWTEEWSVSGEHCYFPVVSYYTKSTNPNYGIDILWYTDEWDVRQKRADDAAQFTWLPSGGGSSLLTSTDSRYPNVTHDMINYSTPKQIWLEEGTEYHYYNLNSTNLPKQNNSLIEKRRAVEVYDQESGSTIRLEMSEPVITLNSGEKVTVPFKQFDYNAPVDVNLQNMKDYLLTDEIDLVNADSIHFDILVTSGRTDTLSDGSTVTSGTPFDNVSVNVNAVNGNGAPILSNIFGKALSDGNGIYSGKHSAAYKVPEYVGSSDALMPEFQLMGEFSSSNLLFNLVNVEIEYPSGSKENTPEKDGITELPTEYQLYQNYPNPFNPSTVINYDLPKDGFVKLVLYDILGSEIAVLYDGYKPAGKHSHKLNSIYYGLSSGVYLYSIQAGDFTMTKKMLLAK